MKSALAKARDEWFVSEDGKECCNGQTSGQYLRNRLERAFFAGAKFSSEQIKELEDKNETFRYRIEQFEYQVICEGCSAKTELSQRLMGCRAKEQIKELEAEIEKLIEGQKAKKEAGSSP